MEQQQYPTIYTRLPNDDDGGYLKFPALLVSKNVAFAIFDEQLEVHLVKPTTISDEYDLIFASPPVFRVGRNSATVFHEIRNTTLVELARKYPLLCTGSLMHLMKQTFAGRADQLGFSTESGLTDDEPFDQQAVTIETLQEIAERVLS